jgi:hypothetical protein
MSIGMLLQFNDLEAGQWFILPDGAGIGFTVHTESEKRPVIFSSSTANMISPYDIRNVYIPDNINISVDSLSFSEKLPAAPGTIILAKNGSFISFLQDKLCLFANLETGAAGDPDESAIWFKKWSLLEKKLHGHTLLLDFNS